MHFCPVYHVIPRFRLPGNGIGEQGQEYAHLAEQRDVVDRLFSQYEQSAPALREFLQETDQHIRDAARSMSGTLEAEEDVLKQAMDEVQLAQRDGQEQWEEQGHPMTWEVASVEQLKRKLQEDGSNLIAAMRAYMSAQVEAASDPAKHQERVERARAFVMAEMKKAIPPPRASTLNPNPNLPGQGQAKEVPQRPKKGIDRDHPHP